MPIILSTSSQCPPSGLLGNHKNNVSLETMVAVSRSGGPVASRGTVASQINHFNQNCFITQKQELRNVGHEKGNKTSS